ncbi:gamma carbonic anhydrase family protein [Peribacillus cavernae]|uniref:Gamma carbonic anhydrase family protein n=1 Tax=Peribacillus cavernae TaxID=1674310 RepID=A0A3S0VME8_9BACI|nr:gamma carbonic anhydrase family protein [Peribacillus cavernae]MDQ0218726.1 carbonic anhydrase/acetyltransferase-like protein (isoleucine patch superfamily) [Peribacillus cavernae]RUQ30941.1 gamma carbonic anhydrase family protein [Peribacillus cavernae]
MLIPYNEKKPLIDASVFIAPGAYLIGDVSVGENSTIWFNAVLRGDEDKIMVGKNCSIQDNTTLHLFEGQPLIIEDDVTVGHNAILHGCKIGKRTIVGMGSTILDGAEIGEECIIGANTLISPGKKIPPRSLVVGSPGKVVREISEKDRELITLSVDTYVQKGKEYSRILKP